jgi:AcrR family transcriptional regulator
MEQEQKIRIRDASKKLIMQYGVRSVSMDDIAAHLGMSKKTIYIYIKDKEELIDEIVLSIIEEHKACCEADILRSENAVHEVILALDMIKQIHKTMNPSIIFDLQKYHSKSFKKITAFKEEYLINVMRKNLQRGITEGVYRKEIKVDILAKFRIASMFIPFDPGFYEGTNYALLDVEEAIMWHFLHGLVSENGAQKLKEYKQELNN